MCYSSGTLWWETSHHSIRGDDDGAYHRHIISSMDSPRFIFLVVASLYNYNIFCISRSVPNVVSVTLCYLSMVSLRFRKKCFTSCNRLTSQTIFVRSSILNFKVDSWHDRTIPSNNADTNLKKWTIQSPQEWKISRYTDFHN